MWWSESLIILALSFGFSLTGGLLAGLVWIVRLEGRVNVLAARFDDILSYLRRIEDLLLSNVTPHDPA